MVRKRNTKTAEKTAVKAEKIVYVDNHNIGISADVDKKVIMVDFSLPANPEEDFERFPASKRGNGKTLAVVKNGKISDNIFIHATIFTR